MGHFVDWIVIVEATKSFTGKDKPLYLKPYINNCDGNCNDNGNDNGRNERLYEVIQELKHKIVYVVADRLKSNEEMSSNEDVWLNEYVQRNMIMEGLSRLRMDPDDYCIIADLDEIVDRKVIQKVKNGRIRMEVRDTSIMTLRQDMYYYNFMCKASLSWYKAKIVKYKTLNILSVQNVRMYPLSDDSLIEKGGWHLSFFSNVENIINKVKNYSHQEWNDEKYLNMERVQKCIDESIDLFERENIHQFMKLTQLDTYLPVNYGMLSL